MDWVYSWFSKPTTTIGTNTSINNLDQSLQSTIIGTDTTGATGVVDATGVIGVIGTARATGAVGVTTGSTIDQSTNVDTTINQNGINGEICKEDSEYLTYENNVDTISLPNFVYTSMVLVLLNGLPHLVIDSKDCLDDVITDLVATIYGREYIKNPKEYYENFQKDYLYHVIGRNCCKIYKRSNNILSNDIVIHSITWIPIKHSCRC